MSDYNKDDELVFIDEDDIDEELEEMRRGRGGVLRLIAFVTALAFLGLVVLTSLPAFRAPLADLVAQSLQLEKDINIAKLQEAVVQINVVAAESFAVKQKSGTGFNIDPGGVIVTNHHVIEGARNMTIRFPDGKVFKADHWSSRPEMDLAVINLEGKDLPAVPLGSALPATGDSIRVVGNPLGLNNIVAKGKVKQYLRLKEMPERIFAIDAPTYPGNSGSPVFNRDGHVIGIVFASWHPEVDGEKKSFGLAVPVEEVLKL